MASWLSYVFASRGHEDETRPDAPVDLEAQTLDARWSPREDHGEHDVGDRHHHHDDAQDRRDEVHCPVTPASNGDMKDERIQRLQTKAKRACYCFATQTSGRNDPELYRPDV